MNDISIKAENISKQYRLGQVGTGTLNQDINRWWHNLRGKEDPYLKIGDTNDRSFKGNSDFVWSLKDIDFEIEKGDAVGIIGRNGAGKSTLLKLLSKVTKPTTGRFITQGRIASLLEVGTGFHPEMTGRENIFLNGAILGMTKKEIKRKFDEIVNFTGVERYIDTPVKRYSSGMYVRLAFAVAAHLESEILIVDEVLAVGDLEFQKKCLGKMNDVSSGQGRTVLFVSHNMSSIKQLCNKGIYLNNGLIEFQGSSNQTIEKYMSDNKLKGLSNTYSKSIQRNKDVQLIFAEIVNKNNDLMDSFDISEEIKINITVYCTETIPNIYGYIIIKNSHEEILIESDTHDFLPNILENMKIGENKYSLSISPYILGVGEYEVYLSFNSTYADNNFDIPGDILAFEVYDHTTKRGENRNAKTSFLINWK